MSPNRLFLNILVDDPREAARFYVDAFQMALEFESDWFMHLRTTGESSFELGLLKKDSELLPDEARQAPTGGVLTLVVESADEALAAALQCGGTEVEKPRDLFFGQRRALVRAPDGTLLDLSSPCPPDSEWMKKVKPRDGGGFVED